MINLAVVGSTVEMQAESTKEKEVVQITRKKSVCRRYVKEDGAADWVGGERWKSQRGLRTWA